MTSTCRLLPVALLLSSSVAVAETWTDIDQPLAAPVGPAALSFVRSNLSRFNAPATSALRIARIIKVRGGAVIRVQRTQGGAPVFNAGLSLLVLDGRLVAASGTLQGTAAGPAARIARAEAVQRTFARIPGATVRRAVAGHWRVGQELRPAWRLDVARARPFGLWRVVLDAGSGQVLSSVSRLIRVKGKAYVFNPTVGPVQPVELKGLLGDAQVLQGELADVSSCSYTSAGLDCQRHAQPDAAGDYNHEPDEPSFTDGFAEVHSYYHVDSFHRWMSQSFGFARQGTDQQIAVMVNFSYENSAGYTQGMYNAFFGDADGDGRGDLVFGQGKRDFAYDADVIYHEFTHSVVDETSNLSANLDVYGMNLMPMALNEAFADLFSSIRAGDPDVGEYAGNGGIRTLSGSATCPDHLSGESHEDGLLWGRACWAVREQAQDKETFDDVLYKTMVALDEEAGFTDAVDLFLKIAGTTDSAMAALAKAEFAARKLELCTRILPLAEGDVRKGYLMGLDDLPSLNVIPGPMQYKIEVPEDALQLRVDLSRVWGHPGTGTVGAYLREGTPVSFAGTKANYDFVISNTETSILLDVDDADHRLVPGGTYYVIPLNVGAYDTAYQLSMSMTRQEPPAPDSGPPLEPDAGMPALDAAATLPADPDGAAGCSCSVQGAPATLPLPLLLALALALTVLRRSRR